MASKAKEEKQPGFEERMQQLEEITSKMEEGGLPLEEMLKLYRQGSELEKQCRAMLDETEKEIEVLTKEQEDTGK